MDSIIHHPWLHLDRPRRPIHPTRLLPPHTHNHNKYNTPPPRPLPHTTNICPIKSIKSIHQMTYGPYACAPRLARPPPAAPPPPPRRRPAFAPRLVGPSWLSDDGGVVGWGAWGQPVWPFDWWSGQQQQHQPHCLPSSYSSASDGPSKPLGWNGTPACSSMFQLRPEPAAHERNPRPTACIVDRDAAPTGTTGRCLLRRVYNRWGVSCVV